MLNEEIRLFTKLTGEDAEKTSISRIGGYLDGYHRGKEEFESKKGKWSQIIDSDESMGDVLVLLHDYECSCCHNINHFTSDYCPNCGAYMKGDRDEQT